ncbi:MAG: hypothetical protein ABIG71_02400 [Candidatus Uhrbacteria bacterium]
MSDESMRSVLSFLSGGALALLIILLLRWFCVVRRDTTYMVGASVKRRE